MIYPVWRTLHVARAWKEPRTWMATATAAGNSLLSHSWHTLIERHAKFLHTTKTIPPWLIISKIASPLQISFVAVARSLPALVPSRMYRFLVTSNDIRAVDCAFVSQIMQIAFRIYTAPYNPNCIRAGVNGSARVMDGIALKCDLHSAYIRAGKCNYWRIFLSIRLRRTFHSFRFVVFGNTNSWGGMDAPFSCPLYSPRFCLLLPLLVLLLIPSTKDLLKQRKSHYRGIAFLFRWNCLLGENAPRNLRVISHPFPLTDLCIEEFAFPCLFVIIPYLNFILQRSISFSKLRPAPPPPPTN